MSWLESISKILEQVSNNGRAFATFLILAILIVFYLVSKPQGGRQDIPNAPKPVASQEPENRGALQGPITGNYGTVIGPVHGDVSITQGGTTQPPKLMTYVLPDDYGNTQFRAELKSRLRDRLVEGVDSRVIRLTFLKTALYHPTSDKEFWAIHGGNLAVQIGMDTLPLSIQLSAHYNRGWSMDNIEGITNHEIRDSVITNATKIAVEITRLINHK